MIRQAVLSVGLLSALAAGALPPDEVKVERNIPCVMRDGAKLMADIYRPAGAGPFPVLLLRTAYGKQVSDSTGMAKRGYIVVVQDTRGRGASEGIFQPFFDDELDGYDTVEWAAQLPGSNGKVGMFGSSYSGATQVSAAMASPPHLVTIVPVFPAISFNAHQNLFEGGAFRQLLAETWTAAQSQEHYPKTIGRLASDRDAFLRIAREAPVGGFMDVVAREWLANGGGGYFRDWVAHAPGSEYWDRINVARKIAGIKVPALYIGGWFDIFGPATIELFAAVREGGGSDTARSGSQLIMGPWTHGGSKFPVGDADFGPSAAISFGAWQNKWFDYWLKDEKNDTARQAPARVFLMGANRWLELPQWEPRSGSVIKFYLGPGGGLSTVAPVDGGTELIADPSDPVPTLGGKLCCHGGFPAGTFNHAEIGKRPDVLTFTTQPLDADLTIAGDAVLNLVLIAGSPDADVIARLMDVAPDGKALPVADGVLRLQYRNGAAKAEPMKAGARYRARIDLGPVAAQFRAGHRMGLQLAGSDFPNYSVNLNSGERLADGRRPRVARTVIVQGRAGAFLEVRKLEER